MSVSYLQLQPQLEKLPLCGFGPFKAVVIIEQEVTSGWRRKVSEWLVENDCLYMLAWGHNCSAWDDSVDIANLEQFDYGEIPDDRFIMTTWHESEPLHEVFWFSKHSAIHPHVELMKTVLIHVSVESKERELLESFKNV